MHAVCNLYMHVNSNSSDTVHCVTREILNSCWLVCGMQRVLYFSLRLF